MIELQTSSFERPTVAAVVVTYNNRTMLRQCLTALASQTYSLVEIVVVDNGSSDGTAGMVKEEFPEVTVRALSENRGAEGGFHEAIQIATRRTIDWIWMMDDDAEPQPQALERLFAAGLHEEPDTVALTPLKLFPSGTPQYDHSGWYNPVHAEITPVRSSTDTWTEVEYGGFAGLLCRVSAIEEAGLPDPEFFFWYGDVEFCLRLREIGRLYLVRSSTVIHHVSEERRSTEGEVSKPWRHYSLAYYWRFYYSYRNRLLILHRHVASLSDRMWGAATIIAKALRSAAMLCVYHEREVVEKLWLLTRGLVDGLLGRSGKRVDPEQYTD